MDQRVLDSASQAEIDEVFTIVSEITRFKNSRPQVVTSPFLRHLEELSEFFLQHALAGSISMFALAGLSYYFQSRDLLITSGYGFALSIVLALIVMILVTLSIIPVLDKIRKDPYFPFLESVKFKFMHDKEFAEKLAKCDVNAIRYVLTYYKCERVSMEKRNSLPAGSLEKIGIFPAIGGAAVLWLGLRKLGIGHDWAQMTVPLTMAFHFMNMPIFGMLQQMDRVIGLLEFSIASRD